MTATDMKVRKKKSLCLTIGTRGKYDEREQEVRDLFIMT